MQFNSFLYLILPTNLFGMYEIISLLFLIIILAVFIFEKILELLNASWFSKPIPKEFNTYFNEIKEKGFSYKKSKFTYTFFNSTFSFLLTLFFWYLGGFGKLSQIILEITDLVIVQNLLFFGFIAFFSGIVSIPFSWYYHFVLEEKYGFNKMSLRTFVLDLFKSSLLSMFIGGGLLSLIVWIYGLIPNHFWWVVWLVIGLFMIFTTAFYARLIVPLFNKQSKLEDGVLKDAIFNLSKRLGFQLQNIYVMDGSKRSSKANAYFTGLGAQKRIVLYDTLINDLDTNEILAVLAHEIGHYKHKHTLINIILGLVQTGLMLYLLSLFIHPESPFSVVLNQVVARDLSLNHPQFYLGIIGFGILFTPVSTVLGLLMNILSRKFEYQADQYAVKANLEEALITGLIKLSKNSLSNLNPHPFYVFVNYSHPALIQRIKAIKSSRIVD